MKNKAYLILIALALTILSLYILGFFGNLESVWYRKFGRLKERATPSNFRVRERINEHPDSEGLLATSLFGKKDKYIRPLLNKKKIYVPPGWYVRVYLCPALLNEYQKALLEKDYEIFVMEKPSEGLTGAGWRFLPLEEGKPFLCLDADDFDGQLLGLSWSPCEALFYRWKKDPRPFVFFESTPCSAIVAGKWGSNHKYPGLARELEKYDLKKRGADELFLKENILPLAQRLGYLRLKTASDLWAPIIIITGVLVVAIIIFLAARNYLKVKIVP